MIQINKSRSWLPRSKTYKTASTNGWNEEHCPSAEDMVLNDVGGILTRDLDDWHSTEGKQKEADQMQSVSVDSGDKKDTNEELSQKHPA